MRSFVFGQSTTQMSVLTSSTPTRMCASCLRERNTAVLIPGSDRYSIMPPKDLTRQRRVFRDAAPVPKRHQHDRAFLMQTNFDVADRGSAIHSIVHRRSTSHDLIAQPDCSFPRWFHSKQL